MTIVRTNDNALAADMSKKQQTDETAITASQSIKFHKCQLLAFSLVAALHPGSFSLSQCVGKSLVTKLSMSSHKVVSTITCKLLQTQVNPFIY